MWPPERLDWLIGSDLLPLPFGFAQGLRRAPTRGCPYKGIGGF